MILPYYEIKVFSNINETLEEKQDSSVSNYT